MNRILSKKCLFQVVKKAELSKNYILEPSFIRGWDYYTEFIFEIYHKDYDNLVSPSYYFDLCRLAMTMIDEIRYNHDDELEDQDEYQIFLDEYDNLCD